MTSFIGLNQNMFKSKHTLQIYSRDNGYLNNMFHLYLSPCSTFRYKGDQIVKANGSFIQEKKKNHSHLSIF